MDLAIFKAKNTVGEIEGVQESLVIANDEDLQRAGVVLANVKQLIKNLKAEKERITKPAREIIKVAKEKFSDLEQRLANIEATIKEKMLGYQQVKKLEAKRLETEVAKKFTDGELDMAQAAEEMSKVAAPAIPKGVQMRKVKEVLIVNEGIIPDKYWILDDVTIRKDALAGVVIPGVEVAEKEIIAVRNDT